jgi:hypothetical protein
MKNIKLILAIAGIFFAMAFLNFQKEKMVLYKHFGYALMRTGEIDQDIINKVKKPEDQKSLGISAKIHISRIFLGAFPFLEKKGLKKIFFNSGTKEQKYFLAIDFGFKQKKNNLAILLEAFPKEESSDLRNIYMEMIYLNLDKFELEKIATLSAYLKTETSYPAFLYLVYSLSQKNFFKLNDYLKSRDDINDDINIKVISLIGMVLLGQDSSGIELKKIIENVSKNDLVRIISYLTETYDVRMKSYVELCRRFSDLDKFIDVSMEKIIFGREILLGKAKESFSRK